LRQEFQFIMNLAAPYSIEVPMMAKKNKKQTKRALLLLAPVTGLCGRLLVGAAAAYYYSPDCNGPLETKVWTQLWGSALQQCTTLLSVLSAAVGLASPASSWKPWMQPQARRVCDFLTRGQLASRFASRFFVVRGRHARIEIPPGGRRQAAATHWRRVAATRGRMLFTPAV
jgi:hypothetical protein